MKRRRVIIGYLIPALIVLAVASVALWRHNHPRQLPVSQCSDVYRQYHNVEGIEASYIQDFALNDSTTVAVTVLKATDSVARNLLISDFKISSINLGTPADAFSTGSRLFPKGHPDQIADSILTNNELLVHYRQDKVLYIFHFESEAQFDAIIFYKHNQQKKQSSKKNGFF